MRSAFFFFVSGPLLPGYLGAIDIDVREKKRESVDIENFNYRQQIGQKFGLEKACRYKKKVDRSDVDISSVHCIQNYNGMAYSQQIMIYFSYFNSIKPLKLSLL